MGARCGQLAGRVLRAFWGKGSQLHPNASTRGSSLAGQPLTSRAAGAARTRCQRSAFRPRMPPPKGMRVSWGLDRRVSNAPGSFECNFASEQQTTRGVAVMPDPARLLEATPNAGVVGTRPREVHGCGCVSSLPFPRASCPLTTCPPLSAPAHPSGVGPRNNTSYHNQQ